MATVTVKKTAGDYSSLNAAEAGEQDVLGAPLTIECYGFADSNGDTTAVAFDGWTTSAANYVEIVPASGDEAQMPWDPDGMAYKLSASVTYDRTLDINEEYVRVGRIQVENRGSANDSADAIRTNIGGASDVRFEGTYLKQSGSGTPDETVGFNSRGGSAAYTVKLKNVFIEGTFDIGISSQDNGNCTVIYYNDTVVDCNSVGIELEGPATARMKNCLVDDCGTDYSNPSFPGTKDYVNNASSDGTAPSGGTPRTNQTFTFVSGTDWHLDSGDAGALDYGADLSGDSYYPFSDDFDGDTRSGSWDIGADEIAAAPPTGIPILRRRREAA